MKPIIVMAKRRWMPTRFTGRRSTCQRIAVSQNLRKIEAITGTSQSGRTWRSWWRTSSRLTPRTATQRRTTLTATPSQTLPRMAHRAGRRKTFTPGRPPGRRRREPPCVWASERVTAEGVYPR